MARKIKNFNIVSLVNASGCFDLQFRKDTRHERANFPTYYHWKTQFIVTLPKPQIKMLEALQKEIGCGQIHLINGQARFSVQNTNNVKECVIPYFTRHALAEKKKKDFALWQKAVEIIWRNKGKYINSWKKNDLMTLIELHKSSLKYKENPRVPKWMDIAKNLAKMV